MKAMIVWTPLQVINAINTKLNFFDEAKTDLYVCDNFSEAKDVFQNIQQLDIFDNVHFVSYAGSKWHKISNRVSEWRFCLRQYDDVYISGDYPFSNKLIFGAKLKKRKLNIHYIEDGLACYVGNPIFNASFHYSVVDKYFLNKQTLNKEICDYYVYEPSLLYYQSNSVNQLPQITPDNKVYSLLEKVFLVSEMQKLKECVLFFDQPLRKDLQLVDEQDFFNKLQTISAMPVKLKLHPRSSFANHLNDVVKGFPWELYPWYVQLNDVTVSGICTTALFTPLFMYGQKIDCILLAEIFKKECYHQLNKQWQSNIDETIRLGAYLRDEKNQNIMIPKSWEELQQLLKGESNERK